MLLLVCALDAGSARAQAEQGFLCQVFASAKVNLAAPTTGVLDTIRVERGDRVAAGEEIGTLRSDMERAELALAELKASSDAEVDAKTASLAFAQRRLQRNADLVARRMVAESEVDQLRTEAQLAELDLQAARQNLAAARAELAGVQVSIDMKRLRSPIDGVVTARHRSPGELVGTEPVVTIERMDPLHAEAALPVELFGQVRAGDEAHLVFIAPKVESVAATITLVDSFVEPTSNTFGVRVTVPNPDGMIPSGVKCRMRINAAG